VNHSFISHILFLETILLEIKIKLLVLDADITIVSWTDGSHQVMGGVFPAIGTPSV
jgi:hypothetical protein